MAHTASDPRPLVVHISTVHNALDPRIRLKQLRSIAASGMQTCLVTADPTAAAGVDEVCMCRISSRAHRRLWRMLVLAPRAIGRAFAMNASLYHLHDPELLPWAWLLLFRGVPVFYDVHEDYARAVMQKSYLPSAVRRPVAAAVALLERVASLPFSLIIAESCYHTRFPRAVEILNYPSRALLMDPPALEPSSRHLLYTGNVTEDRGALHLARLVAAAPELEVSLVGQCAVSVADRMRRCAGAAADRLHLAGEGRYVPFAEIRAAYTKRRWIAGIVLIPDSPHYRDKHLTKFFEYMAAGLPIIASDLPAWRRLIADQGVGFCVDPEDPTSVIRAVQRLHLHPEVAEEMGRRGRELVAKKYHWDGQAERLVIEYTRAINGSFK